jgi:glycosyltransferase involved in cell wall biosynthesis
VFIDLRVRTAHALKLVLVGPKLDEGLAAEVRQAGLEAEVIVLQAVTDKTLRALYSMARVFIFPSLEEGFGWPILEAQACGCPVVTTAREPMTETGGEAAIYAREGEWTKGVIEVLEMDETRRAALVAAGMENARRYSVKKMVAAYIEFYRRRQ